MVFCLSSPTSMTYQVPAGQLEQLTRAGEQRVAQRLTEWPEVQDVHFRVKQQSGIKPTSVDCG